MTKKSKSTKLKIGAPLFALVVGKCARFIAALLGYFTPKKKAVFCFILFDKLFISSYIKKSCAKSALYGKEYLSNLCRVRLIPK